MSRLALTGSHGFLGWHVRCAVEMSGGSSHPFRVGELFDLDRAVDALDGADRFIHIAGVNRGTDEEVDEGNIAFAEQISVALKATPTPPPVVVFANSVQSTLDNVYGRAKRATSEIIRRTCDELGLTYTDVLLPNLFGEHGRPFYNSFVSTFSHLLARGESPTVETDREIDLLHAPAAARVLLGDEVRIDESLETTSVVDTLRLLEAFATTYATGDIPSLSTPFERDLFNTYRSFVFDVRPAIALSRHADARGSFFEVARSRGGESQSSFSTTQPGVTRGEHYHARKIERFIVLSGTAVIRLQRLFSHAVVEIPATGDEPIAVDMPTFWSHSITNTGSSDLYTSFWINELYDPSDADTYPKAIPA